MKSAVSALIFVSALSCSIEAVAQDASDVETKAYGSYAGGKFDTVDLATGNLFINIPLISYQQRGKLPPLSFSVELNNSPYARSVECYPVDDDGNIGCNLTYYRYDTAAPGQLPAASPQFDYPDPNLPLPGKVGAYITSSYEGPIVNGTYETVSQVQGQGSTDPTPISAQLEYSLIDPSGQTHALESGADNPNLYHAQDGSGWTFLPAGSGNAYDPFDPENLGIGNAVVPAWPSAQYWLTSGRQALGGTGLRLGSVLSPTGITYSYQPVEEPQLTKTFTAGNGQTYSVTASLLNSTATDPSGNTVTRGLWYWTDAMDISMSDFQTFYSDPSHQPFYVDSIGRRIPDIVSLQEGAQSTTNSNSGSCPVGTTGLLWTPPGAGGGTLNYSFCYTNMTVTLAFGTEDYNYYHHITGTMNMLTSIVLPNGTQWTFTYDPQTSNLLKVGLPTGGSVSYKYEVMPDDRCQQTSCMAVQARSEDDGLGHVSTHTYSYNVYREQPSGPQFVTYYTTTETDSMQNDTVHTFNLIGSTVNGFTSNQLFETATDVYQGSSSASSPVRLQSTSNTFEYQWDYTGPTSGFRVINVVPIKTTTTPSTGLSKTVTQQYSSDAGAPLFTARRIVCSNTAQQQDNPSSCTDRLAANYFPPNSYGASVAEPNISYIAPTVQNLYPGTSPDPGDLISTEQTQFLFQVDPRYKAANMIALPSSEQKSGWSILFSPSSQTDISAQSITAYAYDESNGSPQGILGNLTSTTTTSNIGSTPAFVTSSGTVYNINGMPSAKIDGNGNRTTITYDGTGLFASTIQRPSTSGVPHVDYYSYDSSLGFLISHTDENGSAAGDVNHTTIYGHDLMGRVTSIQFPGGGGSSFCYTDLGGASCSQSGPPYKLYTTTTASPDPATITMHTYDGLGRSIQSSVLSDPLGADIVDTVYDLEGRVQSVTNPYRAGTSGADSTAGTTSYTYDALGRKTIQTQPDGTRAQWCYDGLATTGQTCPAGLLIGGPGTTLGDNAFTWTEVSDEKGNHALHVYNRLNQLTGVLEQAANGGAAGLETDYTYDVFGDLLAVSQLGSSSSTARIRAFTYFAPSLVQYACNPETLSPGQSCNGSNGNWYSYDANGNLLQKTDNRGVSISYIYDALNRLLSKVYSDRTTPISCYQYDAAGAANNGVGRLAASWTQSGSTGACSTSAAFWTKRTILSYDPMGRLLSEQQCTPSTCQSGTPYTPSYTYNLAGKLHSSTNGYALPTVGTLQFTSAYDGAGHLQSLTSNWNDGTHPATLFSAQAGSVTPCSNSTVAYSPFGGMINATFGNGLTLNRSYDNRLRTICEVDTGAGNGGGGPTAGTSGFAVVQITGREQSK